MVRDRRLDIGAVARVDRELGDIEAAVAAVECDKGIHSSCNRQVERFANTEPRVQ